MAGMDVSYGDDGTALQVWFGPPSKATRTEATDGKIILKKDDEGHVVGFTHLGYFQDTQRTSKIQSVR